MSSQPTTRETTRASTRSAYEALLETVYGQGFCEETLQRMAAAAIYRLYEAEQVVFLEGDEAVGLYIVEAGWLKLIKSSSSGREQVVTFVGTGETFGEIAALTLHTNLVTAIALEPTTLWLVPGEVFLQLLADKPCMAQVVVLVLAQRLLHLLGLVEDLSLRSVGGRTAQLLLDLSDEEIVWRQPWATQAELAARVGTVPRVLSRALRTLSEEKVIAVGRNQITILDRKKLEEKSVAD
jgi:CRP/FNR family transcriptional regulator, dissimilatory nitrate respiration regulator